MALSYCVDCERAYTNLAAHFKSRRHQQNARSEPVECTICKEEQSRDLFVKCAQCVHTWCRVCDTAIRECPFCRFVSPLQQHIHRRREREVERLFVKLRRFQDRYQRRLEGHGVRTVLVRMTWAEIRTLARLTQRSAV